MTYTTKMNGVLVEFERSGPWTFEEFLCSVEQYRLSAREAYLLFGHGAGPLVLCKDGAVRFRHATPASYRYGALHDAVLTAACVSPEDPRFAMFRCPGAGTVPDVGDMDHPIQFKGRWHPCYRKTGYWYRVVAASVGDQLCAQMVTEGVISNELDMLADDQHPLWQHVGV